MKLFNFLITPLLWLGEEVYVLILILCTVVIALAQIDAITSFTGRSLTENALTVATMLVVMFFSLLLAIASNERTRT